MHVTVVTAAAAVRAAATAAERALGPVDVLAGVAGVLRPAPVLATTDEDWAATFAVNTTGLLNLVRAVVPGMVARGRGSVVTVASNAAGVPRTGMAAYAASKAAAAHLTRCLGLEVAGSGVRCNVVCPGSTDTAMQRDLWPDAEEGRRAALGGDPASFRVGIPLARIADPSDVAEAVRFLASDAARHITMQDLYVDGGASLRA
ncbi:hypothetical protein GCM10023225_35540 [Kineococcus glutinatus]|uniref:2,3-dihydro-2,3-dihydroxybenzoate dehydrogenase n=1 Tax=Kineococcus glutinatus TaxID=1070872 RepID=A0ABP8VJZ3_9ACTN